jgi:RNA polymerase sigma factor (sigma-70 family)
MNVSPIKKSDDSHPSSHDITLIRRYHAGEQGAFDELVANHLDAVYSFVARYVGGNDEAEDIVQDVFIKVWKNLRRFDLNRNFRTWLFTIAKNTALDWLKKKKAVHFSELASGDESGPSFEEMLPSEDLLPSELFDQSLSHDVLATALATLPPDYRAVVLLRLDSQLTFREIAETLDKPLNTVKSHYRRAVSLLRRAAPNSKLLS